MAKSLVEIIASMESELAELKVLQKRLAEVGEQLIEDKTRKYVITDRKDLAVGDEIRISDKFRNGLAQSGCWFDGGVYTVEYVEHDNYDGELTVRLKSADWIEFENIAKKVEIVRV